MTIAIRVYLIRHGETDANRQKIIQGQLDTLLNETGLKQAALVACALRPVIFDVALSSDLSRAATTAAVILEQQPGVGLRKCGQLRERFMGELQGQVSGKTRLSGQDSEVETGPAFAKRAMAWWRKEVVEYTASLPPRTNPYNILVVSHGGFIGTLMRSLIQSGGLRPEKGVVVGHCPNASVSLIEWSGRKGKLVQYGDASHLSTGPLGHNADEIRI
ncbi:phosphoglycerate mutase-like protein [Macrolepiota fuliginosa MF-IS2]|uniref:Phosphoglycerate mutase-like protein n=1 Tax=Macrolepiota fuliginosa MF-IS2 TaxID=1400762 RepID=A0A9P5X8A9_9AGAR|nr:phosphoglycerate mutase-like protein [Macrolepiota fuliginosa MF-IS2]